MVGIQGVLAVLIELLSVAGGFARSWWQVLLACVLIGALALAQAWISVRSVRTVAASVTNRTVEINNVLAPLTKALVRVAAADTLPRKRIAAVAFLVNATASCVGLTPAKLCRATFYSITGEPGSRVFVPWETVGRSDPPFSKFREDDSGEGAEVWRVASTGDYRFVEDTHRDLVPHFDRQRERKYRTFITMPVMFSDAPVGLLTLNAPEPGDLSADDVESMRFIADLAATAIGMAGGKCPDRE